ncbi:MAG: DUF5723 family protein [Bacteroidota bacterium]|nr:DUF5723 family protein [Bacteroidota bacterium]
MTTASRGRALVCCCLFFAAFVTRVDAQVPTSSARLAGASYSNAALADGFEAVGVNPAQIGLGRGRTVSAAVFPFALNTGTDFFSYEAFDKYFRGVPTNGGRTNYILSEDEKTALLDAFPGGNGRLYAGLDATLFAVSVTTTPVSLAFHLRDRIAGSAVIPRALADFFLFGNTPGKTFDFSDTRMASAWTREYGLTVGYRAAMTRFPYPAVSFGATVKLVHGFGYFGLERFDSRLTTEPDSFAVTGNTSIHVRYAGSDWMQKADLAGFRLFPRPIGTGFAMDLGVLAELTSSLRFGLSVTDLGSVNWHANTYEISADGSFRIEQAASDDQFDAVTEELSGKPRPIPSFSAPLPVAVCASFAWRVPQGWRRPMPLTLTAAIRQGLNTAPGNSLLPHASIGTEWEAVETVTLRMGLGIGGGMPPSLAIGAGFHVGRVTLDLATSKADGLVSSVHRSASVAASCRLDF